MALERGTLTRIERCIFAGRGADTRWSFAGRNRDERSVCSEATDRFLSMLIPGGS